MIILNILNAINRTKEKTEIIDFIQMLKRYIEIHFSEEEKFLKEKKIENINEHIKERREFKNKILTIYNDYRKGKDKLDFEIFKVLKDFWKNHIQKYKFH